MLTPEQGAGFLLAATLITVTPGPDNLLVLGLGMAKGRRYGMVFGLGCALGCLSHTLLAVLGVSAAIAASPVAFALLKMLGGGYLIWLGIGAWRSRGHLPLPGAGRQESALRGFFLRGLAANAINPKVILFFLSFLPQFVLPGNGHVTGQVALLGLAFTLQAAVLFGLLGYFSGAAGQLLQRRPGVGLWLDRVAGGVFVLLGLRMLIAH